MTPKADPLPLDEDSMRQDFENWFKGVHGFAPWRNGPNYAANAQPAWDAWQAATALSNDRNVTIREAVAPKPTAETPHERMLTTALQKIFRFPITDPPPPASRLNRIQTAYNEGYEAAAEATAAIAQEALKETSRTRYG